MNDISNEDLQAEFDERRAIMEVSGNMSRADAEWNALQRMIEKYGTIEEKITGASNGI